MVEQSLTRAIEVQLGWERWVVGCLPPKHARKRLGLNRLEANQVSRVFHVMCVYIHVHANKHGVCANLALYT